MNSKRNVPPKWPNPPVDKRLRELWDDYHTTKEIAEMVNAEFGLCLTRNAVIGRIHRMGLEKHPRIYPKREPIMPVEPQPRVYNGPIPLVELTNETCRWPTDLDDLASPAFTFCGKLSANLMNGRPYCPPHTRRATGR